MDNNSHDDSSDSGRTGDGGPHPGFLHPHPKGWTGPHPHTPVENRDPAGVLPRVDSLRAEQDAVGRRLDDELGRLARRIEIVKRARDAVSAAGEACRSAEVAVIHPEPDPEMAALLLTQAEAAHGAAMLLTKRAELPAPAPVPDAVLYLREVAKSYRKGPWPAEVHTALERVADGLEQREKDRGAP